MKTGTRKNKTADLVQYCHFAKEHDMIEVCEWENGEGYDFAIGDKPPFQITHGELTAMIAVAFTQEPDDDDN